MGYFIRDNGDEVVAASEVFDTPERCGAPVEGLAPIVPLPADPFLDPAGADKEVPF